MIALGLGRLIAIAAVGMSVAALGAPAQAESLDAIAALDAPIDYSADYSLTANGQTWRGTVIHAPGRERREFGTVFGTQAILLRLDIDQAAVLWPQRKWYLTTSLKALTGMFSGGDGLKLERHRDGAEVIGDEECLRWVSEGSFTGHMWISKDGILVRASGLLHLKGRETTVATQLSHIKRGAIDPDEFELPLGYHGIPVSPGLLGANN